MQPQQIDQPHTLCPKCNNFILTPNFLIHEARCKGNNRQSSTYNRNSRISNIRSSDSARNSDVQMQDQERIPCPFCGYGQSLAELDTHPNVCPHREVQCRLCKLKFPLSLMQQHEVVCTGNNRDQMPQRPENQSNDRNRVQQNTNDQNRRPFQQQQPRNNVYNNRNRVIQQVDSDQQMSPGLLRIRQERRRYGDRNDPADLFRMLLGGFPNLRPVEEPFQRQQRRVIVLDPGALIYMLARRARQGTTQTGLSKQQIRKFPITAYRNHENQGNHEDQDMCAICYCNFEEGENCMNLTCKHKFHPDCIGKWLQKNPTCPLCKKNFKSSSPVDEREQRMPIIYFNKVNLP